jgi:hypothetical protein
MLFQNKNSPITSLPTSTSKQLRRSSVQNSTGIASVAIYQIAHTKTSAAPQWLEIGLKLLTFFTSHYLLMYVRLVVKHSV